jgi:hypothetical protein
LGQTANEWFNQKKTQKKYLIKQIAALKVYLKYVKKGYDIAQKGLTMIGDIKDGNLKMDRAYFGSLKAVNPAIRSSVEVKQILGYQEKIIDALEDLNDWCAKEGTFTQRELAYIARVQNNLLRLSNESLDELTLVITPNIAEMKDDERMQRIDKVHAEMQERYTFVQSFNNCARTLSLERKKNQIEIDASRKIQGII